MPKRNSYLLFLLLGTAPFYANGYVNSRIGDSPILFWGLELLIWVIMPAGILLHLRKHHQLDMKELGFRGSIFTEGKFDTVIFTGLLLTPASFLLYGAFLSIGEILFTGDSPFYYQQMIPESGIARTAVTFYFASSAALVEEFYFRGLSYKAVSFYKRPQLLYLLCSPLLFSLAHWENGLTNIFATFLIGLVNCTLFLWLRNLWPLIIAHMYTDLVIFS